MLPGAVNRRAVVLILPLLLAVPGALALAQSPPPAPLSEPVAPVPVRPIARPPAEPSYPAPPTVARPRGITTSAVLAVPVPRVPVLPVPPAKLSAAWVPARPGPGTPWMGRGFAGGMSAEPSYPAPPALRADCGRGPTWRPRPCSRPAEPATPP